MRVFISWSGELSRQLAEAIRNWLPSALQYVRPYFTPADIDKGAKWSSEIFKELSTSSVCIIVLTRKNVNSSWIMFEAGAISCTIENARVCPLIFDVEPTDLQGPLAQFQFTKFAKEDIRRLFITINSAAADNKLTDAVAEAVFNKWWPDLEQELRRVLDGYVASKKDKAIRSDRELIEEILLLARNLASEKATPPPQAPKYEGTLYQQIMSVMRIMDANLISMDDNREVYDQLVALHTAVSRRIAPSELQVGLLKDIASLAESNKPKPKGKVARRGSDIDDEIPF